MEGENTADKRPISRKRKLLIVFLIVFAVIFSVVTLLGHFVLDDFFKSQIKESVYKSSGGQYILEIGDLNADIWSGNVYFTNLVLSQDTTVLVNLKAQNPETYLPFITLKANSASISNFRWLNYLIDRDLKVGKVEINDPELQISGEDPAESLRSTNQNFIELLPAIIAGFAGSLRIKELVVNSGKVNYRAYDEGFVLAQNAEDIFIDIKEINIDTVSRQRLLYSEDIAFSLGNYQLRNSRKDQLVTIAGMRASVADSAFKIINLGFTERNKTNAKVSVEAISGSGVDFRSFFYGKQIMMDEMLIEKPVVDATIMTVKENKSQKNSLSLSNPLIPELLSEVLESFSVRLVRIENGAFRNAVVSPDNQTVQSASDIFIQISKVEGRTSDTLELSSPDQISIRLAGYNLKKSVPSLNIHIEAFSGSTQTGELALKNLNLDYSELQGKNYKINVKTSIQSATGSGLDFKTILDQQKVLFKEFVIESPDISVTTQGAESERQNSEINNLFKQKLPEPVTAFVKSFEIGNVTIRNGKLGFEETKVANPITQRIGNLNTRVTRLYTKSEDSPVDFQNIMIQVKDYFLEVGKENFSLEIQSGVFSSANSTVEAGNVKIVQDHPPEQEANHYTVTIPLIVSKTFDIKRAVRLGEFVADEVNVNQLRGEFLMHLARPPYAEKMPNELIRNINFYFKINKINFGDAFISHADATQDLTTLITFENAQGTLCNFTNDKNLMTSQSPAVFKMSADIYGKGTLSAIIQVPLLSNSFNAYYTGNFTGMAGTSFNTVLKNTEFRIRSGIVDTAFFNISVINGEAKGHVGFLYHNLDVEIQNKQGEKSRLKSLLGNFVVKNSNPDDPDEEPEIVEVEASREEHDSFFFFLWKPVLEGVLKTVTKGRFLPEKFTER